MFSPLYINSISLDLPMAKIIPLSWANTFIRLRDPTGSLHFKVSWICFLLNTTQKEGLDSHQINKKQPSAGRLLDLQLLRKHNTEAGKHLGVQSPSVRHMDGQSKRKTPSLPCFQADQGVLDSLLIKFGHVLVHVGVVVPDVSLCTAVGHRAKSKGRGIVVRSLKLQRDTERKRAGGQPSFCLGSSVKHQHALAQDRRNPFSFGLPFCLITPSSCLGAPGSQKQSLSRSLLFPRAQHRARRGVQ